MKRTSALLLFFFLCKLLCANELEDKILAALGDQLRNLQTIQVEATHRPAFWDDSLREWNTASKEARVTSTLDLKRKMFRASFSPRIAIWVGGNAPYAESVLQASYNGEWGVVFTTEIGSIGERLKVAPQAIISNDVPNDLIASYLSAAKDFWVLGMKCSVGLGFLEALSSPDYEVTIIPTGQHSKDPLSGCVVIQLREWRAFSTERFWLDPERGYALLRREYSINNIDGSPTGTRMTYDVPELQQVGTSNIWYPKKAVYEVYALGKPSEHHEINVISAILMAEVSAEQFSISLPAGTRVSDERMGISFTVSNDEPKAIDAYIKASPKLYPQ